MTVSVIANALDETARFFEMFPETSMQAAALAINTTTQRKTLPMARKEMRDQVNFPDGYLETEDRLAIIRKASKGSLEAVIRGRDRPTSLARFRQPGQNPGNTRGRGIRVQVKRGKTQVLRKAFLVNLRSGNVGLAVRLKPGEQLANTTAAVQLAKNVYLLYGPSVDQVFRTVASDVGSETLDDMATEFYRQFARLSSG